MKKFLNQLAILFGFNKNSKYVNDYIHDQNIRSGLFMGGIIVFLEIWLIGRQAKQYFDKYGANPTFEGFWNYIAIFVLFLLVGFTFAALAATRGSKVSPKKSFLITTIPAACTFIYSFYIFYPKNFSPWNGSLSSNVYNWFLILIYASAFLLSIVAAILSIQRAIGDNSKLSFLKKIPPKALEFASVVLFAIICMSFGIRVSFSDGMRSFLLSGNPSKAHNEIICFLTMSIFVAALLVWRPWFSIVLHLGIFLGFFFLLKAGTAENIAKFEQSNPGVYFSDQFTDGDRVNYITFYVSLATVSVMIYHQRRHTAIKNETLFYIADYDALSGLHNFEYYVRTVRDYVERNLEESQNKMVLYVNLSDFGLYNDQKGFAAGNEFLTKFGEALAKEFNKPEDVVCRQNDDHYVVFTDYQDNLQDEIDRLNQFAKELDEEIHPEVNMGVYHLRDIDEVEDVRRMVDKARYACNLITDLRNISVLEYDMKMHKEYHIHQYVIHNVDKAVENGWVVPYYQPVVYAKDSKLCGFEALARWIDPKYGFLSPGMFIPTLESVKLIHKVDMAVIEAVCRDIRRFMDSGLKPIPVSINFSRLDFELCDIIGHLEKMIEKYNIPKDALHVEITESALMDDTHLLEEAAKKIKDAGYALWLDDFGSGYSSLNVLKDYDFDVMKLDMAFLKNFSQDNEKAKKVIKSVFEMARQLGMNTLAEGVETKEQQEFLASVHCEKLQGYLFGKPFTYDEAAGKIANKEFILSEKL